MSLLSPAPTIAALHAAYAEGRDPAGVVAETYRRIAAAADPGIFIALVPETQAVAAARALGPFDPQRKPLWGIPFAIKDNIDLAGLPTTAACPEFAYHPAATAFCVTRLIEAGAIPVGKTNLDQFATGLVGLRTPYPAPRNPFDPAIISGGSSSGSAVAVSLGLMPFALGTDTAGSGRVPAGLNNVVGLKPTRGAVSARGVLPACRTLDCVSVFALTVADAASVYLAMAGFDPNDPYSRRIAAPQSPDRTVSSLRLGVPGAAGRDFAGDRLAQRAFDASLADAAAVGLAPQEVEMTAFIAAGRLLYEGPWVAERYHAVGDFIARHPSAVDPTVRRIILAAAELSAVDAFAGSYRLAELRRATEAVWQSVDALLVPTVPRPRRLADIAADPVGANAELGTYTNFGNLLDLCALAIPGRFRDDGLPSGITLIAPAGCDDRIAAIGTLLQSAAALPLGCHLNRPGG